MASNSRILIEDLIEKNGIEDDNLMIIEDDEDTKKASIYALKKALNGDNVEPSDNKFYSSQMVHTFHQDISRELSNRATKKSVERLDERIKSIIASNGDGNKDTELVDARNGYATLSERLSYDDLHNDSKYMSKIHKNIKGKRVDLCGHRGFVDIHVVDERGDRPSNTSVNIIVYSKNLLSIKNCLAGNSQLSAIKDEYNKETGIKVNEDPDNASSSIIMRLDNQCQKGKYKLLADIDYSANFKNKHVKMYITYIDGVVDVIPYNHEETFVFEAKKNFTELRIEYISGNKVINGWVSFNNLMLVENEAYIDRYYPYYRKSIVIQKDSFDKHWFSKYDFYNEDYIFQCNTNKCQLSIDYYDHIVNAQYINDKLEDLEFIINDERDKCGLIEDYGTYQYLDKAFISEYEDGATIEDGEYEYKRNGVPSKKITIAKNSTKSSTIKIPLDSPISIIDTAGLLFFINKPECDGFSDKNGGLKFRLCSDNLYTQSEVNYYEYTIKRSQMLQGWNFIKRRLIDFTPVGNPDPNGINYITIQIDKNDNLNGKSFYINSVIFNQVMKPTILLSFNGVYDETVSYLCPFLKTRGIKSTIFLNSKRTLELETIDELLKYKLLYGWDIGMDGCHPNKEVLVEDENFRNQFSALKNSDNWLKDNITSNAVSYSAAYGNLRPITVPILKELGYKIAKSNADNYCAFFSKKDFTVPMYLISNGTTVEEIIKKIDYAIDTGQCLSLYTNDVTEYGSDIDSKKIMLESVVNYIIERMNEGDVECLTFKEFYERCVN